MLMSSRPIEAEAMPLPSELTTPPVMKMCRVGPSRLLVLDMVGSVDGVVAAPAREEGVIVGAGVDAGGGVGDLGAGDADAGLQRAQLLELLALLEPARRQAGIVEQHLPAVGVDAEVAPADLRRGAALAVPGHRRAAEVERA